HDGQRHRAPPADPDHPRVLDERSEYQANITSMLLHDGQRHRAPPADPDHPRVLDERSEYQANITSML
ncbi:hypothetical protein C7E18_24605, partial [Stenotrophomonas maltophilia]